MDQHIKVVEEFQYLQEKSENLFSGLKDLTPSLSPAQWKPYFQRTFQVFTKVIIPEVSYGSFSRSIENASKIIMV